MNSPMWRALKALYGEAGKVAAPSPIKLTVLVRTLNEADRIEPCLASARALGGDILVIDAGSTDDTVAICERLGARVIHNAWAGFGPQRRFGEEHSAHDMIFCLDADEIVTPEMAAELRAHFLQDTVPELFIVRKAMVLPKHDKPPPLPFCHELIYVYDRRVARTMPYPNWDKLEITSSQRPMTIRAPMWHFSYRDWFHAIDKGNKMARLAAESTTPRSHLLLKLRLIGELPASFVKFYVLRRYMLAGIDGLIMATVSAIGRFNRVAMLHEKAKYDGK
jgi:glycosyltransferase involved in cell wall biosynthesis